MCRFHFIIRPRVFLTLVNNTDIIPASSVTSDCQQHQWARGLPCDIIPFAVWKTWYEEVSGCWEYLCWNLHCRDSVIKLKSTKSSVFLEKCWILSVWKSRELAYVLDLLCFPIYLNIHLHEANHSPKYRSALGQCTPAIVKHQILQSPLCRSSTPADDSPKHSPRAQMALKLKLVCSQADSEKPREEPKQNHKKKESLQTKWQLQYINHTKALLHAEDMQEVYMH